MKKLIIPALCAIVLSSCDGEEKKDEKKEEVTICECVNEGKEMAEKMKNAGGDEEKMKAIEEEYKDLEKKCKALVKGVSDEEKKKMMEEAKNC